MPGQLIHLPTAAVSPTAGVPATAYLPALGVPGFDGSFSPDDIPEAPGVNITTPLPNRVGEFPLSVQGAPRIEVKGGHRGLVFTTGGSHGFQDETLRLASATSRMVIGHSYGANDPQNRYLAHVGRYVLGSLGATGWAIWARDTASSSLPGPQQLALTGAASESEVPFIWGAILTPTSVRLTIMKHGVATLTDTAAATPGNQERYRIGSAVWGNRGFWTGLHRTWPHDPGASALTAAMTALAAARGVARP